MEPIIVQIGEEADRVRQWAEHGEHWISLARGDAALALARELVKAGFDPARRYEVWRGNMRCMTYRSLGTAAGLSVEEGDRVEVQIAKHRPFTDRPLAWGRSSKVALNAVEATDGASDG